MWQIDPPSLDAETAFLQCISQVRCTELKRRLESIVPNISEAERAFQDAARTGMTHTIVPLACVAGRVTRDEMSAVYTDRMARKDSPGRHIYDAIKQAAPHDRCPLCGQRVVTTLDHYLPKSLYPILAVSPINLVPCCSDCNKAKLDTVAQNENEVTLHPYFDDVEDEVWLNACVNEGSGASVEFSVARPIAWTATLANRVEHHFRLLGLGALYASHAGEELRNIQHYLRSLLNDAGSEAVRLHLEEMAQSRAALHKNSWQTATYRALANSLWYYTEGVLLPP